MQKKKNNNLILLVATLVFISCNYLSLQKNDGKTVIASFEDTSLYLEDLKEFLPKNLSKNDSTIIVRQFIDNWGLQQTLLKKAEENNTESTNKEISLLVDEYRKSLLINRYKEELIQQELDTLVDKQDIVNYYNQNKNNFRLSEELIKARYVTFNKQLINKKEIIASFKKGTMDDLEELESQQLSFKQVMLNDSSWVSLNNVLKQTVFFRNQLLKKTKFIQKEDSINLFLISVKDVLNKNEISPLEFVEDNIKQILLHKRKLEVIREIEKILVRDAIKNKQLVYQ